MTPPLLLKSRLEQSNERHPVNDAETPYSGCHCTSVKVFSDQPSFPENAFACAPLSKRDDDSFRMHLADNPSSTTI